MDDWGGRRMNITFWELFLAIFVMVMMYYFMQIVIEQEKWNREDEKRRMRK